jgi:hypothetical protein
LATRTAPASPPSWGLARLADDADRELAEALFTALKADGADFTLAFRFLADEAQPDGAGTGAGALFDPGLHSWNGCRAGSSAWSARTVRPNERQRRMFAASPAFIPRNHQVQRASRRQRRRLRAVSSPRGAPGESRPFDAASDRDLALPGGAAGARAPDLSVAPEPRACATEAAAPCGIAGAARCISVKGGPYNRLADPQLPGPHLEHRVFGKTLSGPFTIPSGIVTTAPSIIQYFLDEVPQVGVITTKSIGLAPRAGNREPVYSQYAPGCFVNAVGLTNPGAEAALAGLEALEVPEDRFLLTSIFGGSVEEFVRVAELLAPVSDGLELNLSCPHASGYGMAMGQDPELVPKSSPR